ncbi:MADS box transcription factor [Lithospermum erythrorhizon]|uniref:MADS box transcription factor n=1 Tax=Lithospermum erythrorhizon TaxID=34254 RepID=A0AAV3NSG8_LITER
MTKTIEKYQRCSYGALENNHLFNDPEGNYQEYLKLKVAVENLQQSQRHLLGEDLAQLGTKELDQLERQLDTSLKHIRSTKTQSLLDQLSDLHQKEHTLMEVNNVLKTKLEERSAALRASWESVEHGFRGQTSQGEGYLGRQDPNNTVQIGYHSMGQDIPAGPSPNSGNNNGMLPGWML